MDQGVENVALAHRFFDALAAGDGAGLVAMTAPDAVVWQNCKEPEFSFASKIPDLLRATSVVPNYSYIDRKYTPIEGGALVQHRSSGDIPGGGHFSAPIIIRLYISDGRITRFEEYFDRGTLAILYAAMKAAIEAGTVA